MGACVLGRAGGGHKLYNGGAARAFAERESKCTMWAAAGFTLAGIKMQAVCAGERQMVIYFQRTLKINNY